MNKNEIKPVVYLVADIGGTNIRIAQTNRNNALTDMMTYRCEQFSSLFDVLYQYLKQAELLRCEIHACLAIACPTDDDWITMANLPWQFSQQALKQALSLESLVFINDYTAIAMAIPFLSETQKVKVGGGEIQTAKPIAVCGPGTGLGVATLVPVTNGSNVKWQCLNSEGGHMDFAPVDDTDIAILQYLKKSKKRVSYEQLLSGYGLEQIYQALLYIDNQGWVAPGDLTAAEISQRAVENTCKVCELALLQFCKVLGSFAGNLALLTSSVGGVYIAGGIVPRFIDFIQLSDFRRRFEDKGRLSAITQQTPSYIITEPQPGLLGAAVFLNQQHFNQ
jgi:glucokinase